MKVENYSPLDKIKAVMVSAPGSEACLASLYPPEKSLFEPIDGFSVVKAHHEHMEMQKKYQDKDIDVFNMKYIIAESLSNTIFKNKQLPKEINNIKRLKEEIFRRADLVNKEFPKTNIDNQKYLDFIKKEISELIDKDLILFNGDHKKTIIINGIFCNLLTPNGEYVNHFSPKSNMYPLGNQTFWRDTNHISADELVLHKMHFDIRQPEVEVAKMGIKELDINFSEVNCNGSIEGGDILPLEIDGKRYALIGQAERTSKEGVYAWYKIHNSKFKKEGIIPLVIRGRNYNTQDQMHLDTYAQQVGKDGIIHCSDISKERKVISIIENSRGIEEKNHGSFYDFIGKNFNHNFEMNRKEQLNYAPNVLVDGGRNRVFFTRGDSPRVIDFVKNECGQEVVVLDMPNFTKLYGGAHCSTSEIRSSI